MPRESQAVLANMSAVPRTIVKLPRLHYGQDISAGTPAGSASPSTIARLFTRVDLPTSVCAAAELPYDSPHLCANLGLPRVIVALARQAAAAHAGLPSPPLGEILQSLQSLTDAALLEALIDVLQSQAWPEGTPRVGIASACESPVPPEGRRGQVPDAPRGVPGALVTARLVSGIRGPLFLRDAAPAVARLLSPWASPNPLGSWTLWRPIRAEGSVVP